MKVESKKINLGMRKEEIGRAKEKRKREIWWEK